MALEVGSAMLWDMRKVLSVADELCILWGISVFEVYPLVGMVWEVISGCKAALEFEVTV